MYDWLEVALGLVLLLCGAEALVRGAVWLTLALGVSPMLVGVTLVALAVVNFFGMLFTALVPETKQMHLDDAASKSTSTYGRRVQKDAGCPLYEAESRGAASAAAK